MMRDLNGGISRSRIGVTDPDPRLDFTDFPLSLLVFNRMMNIMMVMVMVMINGDGDGSVGVDGDDGGGDGDSDGHVGGGDGGDVDGDGRGGSCGGDISLIFPTF